MDSRPSLILTNPALALSLLVGLVLLVLAAPMTIAFFTMIPGNATLEAIKLGESVEQEDLETLIKSRKDGLYWQDRAEDWTDLALAQLLLSTKDGINEAKKKRLWSQAISSLKTGLAQAPADPFAWARLAYIETVANGPSKKVANALRMSMLTAPYEKRLMFLRLSLAFNSWGHFSDEDEGLILQQIGFAWRNNSKRTVDLALAMERVNLVRKFLEGSPAEESKLEELLRKAKS